MTSKEQRSVLIAGGAGGMGLMYAVMGPEPELRSDQTGARDPSIHEECENLVIEEILPGGCIFVEMDGDFLCRSWV